MKPRKWLVERREEKGYSQSSLAKELKITSQAYNYIENNQRNPSVDLAKKIADVLNFSWTKFFE